MTYRIISTTDGQFIGEEFTDEFPIQLGTFEFSPDYPPITLGDKSKRFFNSNYSIDTREVV